MCALPVLTDLLYVPVMVTLGERLKHINMEIFNEPICGDIRFAFFYPCALFERYEFENVKTIALWRKKSEIFFIVAAADAVIV